MIRRAYRVYYFFNGPSRSDPFREEKSSDEIKEALRRFPSELETAFDEEDNFSFSAMEVTGKDNGIIYFFGVNAEEKEFKSAFKQALNDNDLFAEKLEKIPEVFIREKQF